LIENAIMLDKKRAIIFALKYKGVNYEKEF